MKLELLGHWIFIQKKPKRDEKGRFKSNKKPSVEETLRYLDGDHFKDAIDYTYAKNIWDAKKDEEFGR